MDDGFFALVENAVLHVQPTDLLSNWLKRFAEWLRIVPIPLERMPGNCFAMISFFLRGGCTFLR